VTCSPFFALYALKVGDRAKVRIISAQNKQTFEVDGSEGSSNHRGRTLPCSSRTPDWKISFTSTALDSSPMHGKLIEISQSAISSNPFQVSGSIEMPSIFSAKEIS
jgi:hypothetical protein